MKTLSNKKISTFNSPILLVQARLNSKRLPSKILANIPIANSHIPLLKFLLQRLNALNLPIIVATPNKIPTQKFDFIKKISPNIHLFHQFQGPENDVLGRFHAAAKLYKSHTYIRVTADNPFTSRSALRSLYKSHKRLNANLSAYQGLPLGTGVEIISAKSLTLAHENTANPYHREHVTPYLYSQKINPYSTRFLLNSPIAPKHWFAPNIRLSIDTPQDLANLKSILTLLPNTSSTSPLLTKLIYLSKIYPKLFSPTH